MAFVVGKTTHHLSGKKKGFQQANHPRASKMLNRTILRGWVYFWLWKTALVKDKFQLPLARSLFGHIAMVFRTGLQKK